jgi:hypothetical protein
MSSIPMSTMVLSLSIALLVLKAKALENSYSTKDSKIEDRYNGDEFSVGWKRQLHGWMTMFEERRPIDEDDTFKEEYMRSIFSTLIIQAKTQKQVESTREASTVLGKVKTTTTQTQELQQYPEFEPEEANQKKTLDVEIVDQYQNASMDQYQNTSMVQYQNASMDQYQNASMDQYQNTSVYGSIPIFYHQNTAMDQYQNSSQHQNITVVSQNASIEEWQNSSMEHNDNSSVDENTSMSQGQNTSVGNDQNISTVVDAVVYANNMTEDDMDDEFGANYTQNMTTPTSMPTTSIPVSSDKDMTTYTSKPRSTTTDTILLILASLIGVLLLALTITYFSLLTTATLPKYCTESSSHSTSGFSPIERWRWLFGYGTLSQREEEKQPIVEYKYQRTEGATTDGHEEEGVIHF